MSATKGRCACGSIAYEFTGKPLWVAHCHCESCRRATSSAFATFVGVKLEQFQYLQGEPTMYESSPGVQRYFCGKCGSPMAYLSSLRNPGEVHLYAGTLQAPGAVIPQAHVHTGEQLVWAEIHDELPRFEGPGGDQKPVRVGPRHKG